MKKNLPFHFKRERVKGKETRTVLQILRRELIDENAIFNTSEGRMERKMKMIIINITRNH